MNILIIGANWYNRGDEAAIRAMIDELRVILPGSTIKIHFNQEVEEIPYNDIEIINPFRRIEGRNKIKGFLYYMAVKTKGKIPYPGIDRNKFKIFVNAVRWADYAIYAPGGPCLGDYYGVRKRLLDMFEIIISNNVPFSLFAPSVGPFTLDKKRVSWILKKAEIICFREELSQKYFYSICPDKKTTVTLDSAFQHPVNEQENGLKYNNYVELSRFIGRYKNVIGITITDLKWHSNYKSGEKAIIINETFQKFIPFLEKEGFGVLFIPQLFGPNNDMEYMSNFAEKNSYVMSDKYDCYFQQYIISKLYAVVGMRYHSNIFSAKMGTPFVSISYEQKMEGFMKKAGLQEYCMSVDELSFDSLKNAFQKLILNYDLYAEQLNIKRKQFQKESYRTTEMIVDNIKKACN